MSRKVGSSSLIAQRHALVALARHLHRDTTGGILSPALDMLIKVLAGQGGFVHRTTERHLNLAASTSLPPKAKPWLEQLRLENDGWFVSQLVAKSRKPMIDRGIATDEHAIGAVFASAGWRALAAAPIAMGRRVLGVLVIAGGTAQHFDEETLRFLSAVGGMLGMALERARLGEQQRDERGDATRRAQLATMGLVASTTARELAVPLSALQLLADQQEDLLGDVRAQIDEPSEELLERLDELDDLLAELNEQVLRGQGINARLLALSRESSPEPVDLVRVTHAAVEMISTALAGRGIALGVQGDNGELLVDGREESLTLLLVQLALHAADQCDPHAPSSGVVLTLASEASRHVISVESTGHAEGGSQRRVADAFKRRQSSPLSVGLDAAKQAVLAHKGHIEVGGSEMGGVRIRLVLPPSKTAIPTQRFSPLPAAAVTDEQDEPPIESVVIIDDDIRLVGSIARQLREFQVHAAHTVEDGIALLKTVSPPPLLVLCDMRLPDGLGIDIHAEMPPHLAHRFVFISGGIVDAEVVDYLTASDCPILPKPFAVNEVRALIAEDDLSSAHSRMPTLAPAAEESSPTPSAVTRSEMRKLKRRMAATAEEGLSQRPPRKSSPGKR